MAKDRSGRPALRAYGVPDRNAPRARRDKVYAGTVIQKRAVMMLRKFQRNRAPFLLHVAPYAPHSRVDRAGAWPQEPIFPAAFRDRPGEVTASGDCGPVSCTSLTVGDLPGYGTRREATRPLHLRKGRTVPARHWKPEKLKLTKVASTVRYRDRARMLQSVDRTIKALRKEMRPNTYLVFTSDNGFHINQHGLGPGKGTPYDTDTRVPLVMIGPGIDPGVRDQFVNNYEVVTTIEDIAGLPPSPLRAGLSFRKALADRRAKGGKFVFFEHTQGPVRPGEPDSPPGSGGRLDSIPSYYAVRSAKGLLVRLDMDKSPKGNELRLGVVPLRHVAIRAPQRVREQAQRPLGPGVA